MPFRSFNDFSPIDPIPTDYLVGFRPLVGEFKVNFYTISKIISGGLTTTPNNLYVTISGNDFEFRGLGENEPFKTIKRACQVAAANPLNKYTIFVRSGDYFEQNPVYVPPNCSIIGDNLRRVSVYPVNPTYDIFWVTNADYLWGMTFRGHRSPGAAVAFPNTDPLQPQYNVAFNYPSLSCTPPTNKDIPSSPLYIRTSPYIQGCSSITQSSPAGADNAGAGCRIDGSLVGGYIRSMVMDSYTQFNEGGIGIHITNNGYAQLVSIFTIAATYGVLCTDGGSCDVNTSNCSFGNYGLAAFGKSPVAALTGTLTTNLSGGEGVITVNNVSPTLLATTPSLGMIFEIQGDSSSTQYIVSSAARVGTNTYDVYIEPPSTIGAQNFYGRKVYFYIRSSILASAITFEYVGTGTTLISALPILGGQTILDNEVVSSGGGAVFFTATNQSGDFRVGTEFTIKQSTGTIEGQTFQRSIFSLVTPFVLAIE
jgi:hypothetical protein